MFSTDKNTKEESASSCPNLYAGRQTANQTYKGSWFVHVTFVSFVIEQMGEKKQQSEVIKYVLDKIKQSVGVISPSYMTEITRIKPVKRGKNTH